MGTIYEKLNYLDGTKGLIREAINDKGGELTTSNTFREYAEAITNLPAGSGAAANVLCKVDFTRDTLPVKNISFRGNDQVDFFDGLLNFTPNPLGLHEYHGITPTSFYVNMFVPLVNNTYSIKFGDVHANNLNRDFLEIRGLTVGSNGVITFSSSTDTNTVSVTASDSDTAVDLGISLSDFSNKTLSVKLDLTEDNLGYYTTATWDTFKPYLYIYLDNTLVKRIVYDHVISVGYRDFSSINRNILFMNMATGSGWWYPEILEVKCTANATTEDITISNLNVTQNGTYTESGKLYDTVTVNVEGGGSGPTVEALTVTQNGTYSETGKAYSPVTVALPLDSKTITSNGTYTASTDNLQGYSSVTVNVASTGYNTYDITNNPITFSDGVNLPMAKCDGVITATQSGTGTPAPDNVRSISGVSEINFLHSNKNLVNKVAGKQFVYIPSGTGVNFEVENATGVTVTLYGYIGETEETLLTCESGYIESVATTKDYDGIGFKEADITALGDDGEVYVSIGDSSDMAVTHAGTTKNITLDSTCYGGTYDFLSGELTTNYGFITLDGTQSIMQVNWNSSSTGVGWIYPTTVTPNALRVDNSVVQDTVCNMYEPKSYNQLFSGGVGVCLYNTTYAGLVVRTADTSLTTAEAINAYLADNPIQVIYPLATPTTEQYTPITKLSTYNGYNYFGTNVSNLDTTIIK